MPTKSSSGGWFTPERLEQLDAIERKYQLISAAQKEEHIQAKDKLLADAAEEARCLANRRDIPQDIENKMRQLMAANLELRLQALKNDYEKKTADCEKEKKDAERSYLRRLFEDPPKEEESGSSSPTSATAPANGHSGTSPQDKRHPVTRQQVTPQNHDGHKGMPKPGASSPSTEAVRNGPVNRPKVTTVTPPKPGPSSSSLMTPQTSSVDRSALPKAREGGTISAKRSSIRRTSVTVHPTRPHRLAAVAAQGEVAQEVVAQEEVRVPAHHNTARSASVSVPPSAQANKTPHKRKSTSALDSSAVGAPRTKRPRTATSANPQDERTVTYDEVYQNGEAKYKHAIISWDGKWYILKCEEHSVHFRMSALAAAAKHLDSAAHGHLGRQQDQALRLLGYRVLGCDQERADRHNKLVKEAFDNGYKPLGVEHKNRCKQLRKQSISAAGGLRAASLPSSAGLTTTAAATGTTFFPAGTTAQASRARAVAPSPLGPKHQHPNKQQHASKGLGIITNPRAGGLYFATPKPKLGDKPRKYIVMILAWKDLTPCGYRGTSLGSLPLLQGAHRQACYTYDRDGITGWAPGYEEGGKSVKNRWFPVLWFEKRTIREGWVRAAELSHFPMLPARNRGPGHPETRARTQYELGRRFMREKGATDPDATDGHSDSAETRTQRNASGAAESEPEAELPLDEVIAPDDENDMDYEYDEEEEGEEEDEEDEEDVLSNTDASSENLPRRPTTTPPARSVIDLTATTNTTPSCTRTGAAAGTRSSRKATSTADDVRMSNGPGRRGIQSSSSADGAKKRKKDALATPRTSRPPAKPADGPPGGKDLPAPLTSRRGEDSGPVAEAEPQRKSNGEEDDKEGEQREKMEVRLGTPVPPGAAEEEEEEGRVQRGSDAAQKDKRDEVAEASEACGTQQKMPDEAAMASSAVAAGASAVNEDTEGSAANAGLVAREKEERKTEDQRAQKDQSPQDQAQQDQPQQDQPQEKQAQNTQPQQDQAQKNPPNQNQPQQNQAQQSQSQPSQQKQNQGPSQQAQKNQPQQGQAPQDEPQQDEPQQNQNPPPRKSPVNGDGGMQPPRQVHQPHLSGLSSEAERKESRQRFLSELARHNWETSSRGASVPPGITTPPSGPQQQQQQQQQDATGRPSFPATPTGEMLSRRNSDWASGAGWAAGNLGELARRAIGTSDTPRESRFSPGLSTPRGQSPFAVKSEPDAFDLCSFRQGERQWKAGSPSEAARLRVDEVGGVARAKEGTAEEITVDPRRVQRFQYNRSKDRSQHELVLFYGERAEDEQRLMLETGQGRSKMQGLRFVRWLREVNPRVEQLPEVTLG